MAQKGEEGRSRWIRLGWLYCHGQRISLEVRAETVDKLTVQ
jgi:hypothetical protein